jgi:hypothetical protein
VSTRDTSAVDFQNPIASPGQVLVGGGVGSSTGGDRGSVPQRSGEEPGSGQAFVEFDEEREEEFGPFGAFGERDQGPEERAEVDPTAGVF